MYTVYKHITPNNKIYIGITSKNPIYRWRYGNGYRTNPHFWKAIQKYGWDNIRHEILFENLTQEEAEQKEMELISLYQSTNPRYGYNLEKGGLTLPKHTPQSIEKMRQAKLGKKMSEECKQKHREARLGYVVPDEVKEKFKGNKYAQGHKHTDEWKEKMSKRFSGEGNPNYGIPMSDIQKEKISANTKNKRKVVQLTKDGVIVKEYNSAKEAERETGIHNPNIIACCKGKKTTAGGYIWKYDEDIRKSA